MIVCDSIFCCILSQEYRIWHIKIGLHETCLLNNFSTNPVSLLKPKNHFPDRNITIGALHHRISIYLRLSWPLRHTPFIFFFYKSLNIKVLFFNIKQLSFTLVVFLRLRSLTREMCEQNIYIYTTARKFSQSNHHLHTHTKTATIIINSVCYISNYPKHHMVNLALGL